MFGVDRIKRTLKKHDQKSTKPTQTILSPKSTRGGSKRRARLIEFERSKGKGVKRSS